MRVRAVLFEDDAAIRQVLRALRDARGYEVFSFPDPGLCPLHVMDGCPCPAGTLCADIIISDLNMRQVNGLDFIEELLTKGCAVPHFILISGGWSAADEERAARLGCRVFPKPFPLPDLVACLETIEALVSPKRHLLDWGSLESGAKGTAPGHER